jgi:hypothetical protein
MDSRADSAQPWNAVLDHLGELTPPIIAHQQESGKTNPRQHEHCRRYARAPLKKHSEMDAPSCSFESS